MPLTAGERLGPDEIVALLGAGGMGEVYRARDSRLDRTVAIKLLAPHVAADPDFDLFTAPATFSHYSFVVDPAGERFLLPSLSEAQNASLTVVLNWTTALTRK